MNKLTGWQQVAVIALVVGAITTLMILGKDTSAMVALGIAVLTGLGMIAGQTSAIQKQTNGTQTQMVAAFKESTDKHSDQVVAMAQMMAQMQPPAARVVVDDAPTADLKPVSPASWPPIPVG